MVEISVEVGNSAASFGAVHIHFKIRDSPEAEQGYEFAS
jgi:hypothetical protein